MGEGKRKEEEKKIRTKYDTSWSMHYLNHTEKKQLPQYLTVRATVKDHSMWQALCEP